MLKEIADYLLVQHWQDLTYPALVGIVTYFTGKLGKQPHFMKSKPKQEKPVE